jgi:cytochrome c-type biogenesis protein CcmE
MSSNERSRYLRFGIATAVIVLSLGYLAFTGVEESKSYYVTIAELRKMGDNAYSKRLRVAGNVVPGSIQRQGSKIHFELIEQEQKLAVVYSGSEAPPDTFVDNAQALAEGEFGRDGVFHAKKLQAKCASKYAPKEGEGAPGATTTQAPATSSAPQPPAKSTK